MKKISKAYKYNIQCSIMPSYRWLYWTDWGTTPRIVRSSMDGKLSATLHSMNLTTPFTLALDYKTQILYWSDNGLNQIESSSTDGSSRIQLIMTQSPFAMTFYKGNLYWSSQSTYNILKAPVTTMNSSEGVTTVFNGLSYLPYDIHILSEEQKPNGKIVM